MTALLFRLRKHADYQHAYSCSAKQTGRHMTVFFAIRAADRRSETPGARVGLTVPRAIGKAHERNRIKRRMRVIVRRQLSLLHSPVDIIMHPRRTVLTADFSALVSETAEIFSRIQQQVNRRGSVPFPERVRVGRPGEKSEPKGLADPAKAARR